jgi:hypothetical protein
MIEIGIGFVDDLISKVGIPLVSKGIKALTGIDIESKELTAEDKQKILNSQIEIMKIDFEKLKLDYQNTNDARDMQKVALQQDDKFSKRFVYYLASFWSFVCVIYIFFITFGNIPSDNIRFADTILGFLLGTIIATIINFFLGSSKGSADKQDFINQLKKENK